jgi:hypothetical protein
VFRRFWKRVRSVSASGSAVANSESANPRGERFESSKFMSLNVTSPDVTSGELPIVVPVPQVTTSIVLLALPRRMAEGGYL